MELSLLETNNPPTDSSNGWVILGLMVFVVGILGSVGFFFKQKVLRYRHPERQKIKPV